MFLLESTSRLFGFPRAESRYLRSLKRGRQNRLQRGVSRQVRVIEPLEDRTLLTIVNFADMIAEVEVFSDDGDFITAFLRGSAMMDVQDTPTQLPDGRDVVQTEIVSMDLQGFDSFNGPVTVRVSSMTQSLGTTAERTNTTPGQIDTVFNVDSFFDVVIEVDALVDDPENPGEEIVATLHGTATITTGIAGSSAVPVASGGTMRLSESFDLFFDPGQTLLAGFSVDQLDITFQKDLSSIQGQKWHDLNGDGVKDTGEPGLDNWIIVAIDLDKNVPVDAQVTRSIDVDMSGGIDPDTEQGLYSFDDLPPGRYFITEMQQSGWSQTFPSQIPAGELPEVGPGTNWIQNSRQGNDFLDIGMLAVFDWDNDGSGDENVYLQGGASIFAGNYDGGTDSVTVEVGEFNLLGESSFGPVRIHTGDSDANNMMDGPLHLSGQFIQDPGDTALADSFFDIFVELDVGNTIGSTPAPETVWTNSTAIHVESKVDRLPPIGLPYQMTNAEPVQFRDSESNLQAQLIDLRFTTFREELFDDTVGYIYDVDQGQQITNVLFGNRDLASGPFGVDYGDAPAPYPTLSTNNGAAHDIDGKHFLGRGVDAEPDGQPDLQALGDDRNQPEFSSSSDDEDGVLFIAPLVADSSSNIVVIGSQFATGQLLLNAWFDFDGNGSWADSGEQIFTDQAINPGVNQLPVTVPAGVTDGAYVARFRVSTAGGLSYDGPAPNGEVEDYLVPITANDLPLTDWGDAPVEYPTLAASSGAFHAIDGVTVFGSFIDGEAEGQPTATADGDDAAGPIDDEDGIFVSQQLATGDGGLFEINTLNGGFLNAWVDFNADGDWDDLNEQIASEFSLVPGRNSLSVFVPEISSGTALGETFARFRLSPSAGEANSPMGPADNPTNPMGLGFGEVEDIALTIYQGELTAQTDSWELSVVPQEIGDSVGQDVGVVFFGNDPDVGTSTSLLNQQWYWFSIDGGPVQRLDTLTLVSASSQFANPITLTYGDLSQSDPIQVDLSITLNEISDSIARIDTSAAITNLTGAPINIEIFAYSDLDLNGSLGQLDRATVVSESQIDVNGISGSSVSSAITGDEPVDRYEIATVGPDGTAFPFQLGVLSDLLDVPDLGETTAPGNIAIATQWTRTIASGGVLNLSASQSGDAIPIILPEIFPGGFVTIGGGDGGSGGGSDGGSDGGFDGGTGGSSSFGGLNGPGIGTPGSFDPAFAIGYDFNATVNRFRSVQLPSGIGDDQYMVSYLDDMSNPQTVALSGSVQHDFNTDANVADGVSDFRVLGIESTAGIDVADPIGFVTALSFVTETPFSFTQTGVPEFIYVSEDGRLREDVDIGGSLGVLETGDEGTWLPATSFEETGLTFGFTLFDSLTAAQNHISSNNYTGLSTIVTPPVDYGDAPDTGAGAGAGNYQTLESDGGPSHTIVAGLFLGAAIDGEGGTLQNVAANADDVDGALPDDEDGVLNPLDLRGTVGAAPTISLQATNTTGNAATLSGWIDFNADGVFDNSTERTQISVPDGTTDVRFTLTFPTIPGGSDGGTYARFRLSTDAAAANPSGAASDGEVEDYVFSITSPGGTPVDSGKSVKIAGGTGNEPTLADGDTFGSSVASLGDLDGDGVTDVVVGAPHDNTGGVYSDRGAAHVLLLNDDGSVKSSTKIASGMNGGPTLADGDNFGRSVTSLGDLDGDGVTDIAVGAHRDDAGGDAYSDRGAVYVLFMNTDGSVKSSTKIASGMNGGPTLSDNDFFGSSVASLGDLDGDGVNDLAVGAFGDDTGGGAYSGRGALHLLLLNSDGSVKGSTKIASGTNNGPTLADGDLFGYSAAAVGDLNGDGVGDLAVGAFGDGAVHVLLLNADSSVNSSIKIASDTNGGPTLANGDYFGSSVASLGDMDGDGVGDLAVGAYGDSTGGDLSQYRGAVHLLLLNSDGSAKSSTKIASDTNGGPTLSNGVEFGSSVASLGDLNGDGVIDLAVGARYDNRGAVYVMFLKEVDVVAPTVTVNIVDASLNDSNNSSAVTFEFSEDVSGFDGDDLTVAGGVLSNFMAVDSDSFTATFTADDDLIATGSVTVGTGYTDVAGNMGTSGSDTVEIDTQSAVVAQFDLRVVTQPTALASNGEAVLLPTNEPFLHEWESFDVEIWVSTPGITSVQISSAVVDLAYNTQLFTATAIEFSPGFAADGVPVIDDSAGTVTGINGTVVGTGVADDQFALLARVQFESRPGDQLAIDFDNELIGPASLGLSLSSADVVLPESGTAAIQIGPLPTTEVFAVIYDIDDSGGVSFGDLSPFADAFGDDVATSDSPFAWIADFDKSGRVGFGDLSSFADAFGKTQASPGALAFPDNFPDAWRSSALVASSLPHSTGENSPADSVAPDAATVLNFLSIARESFVLVGAPGAIIPGLADIDIQVVDLPGRTLGLAQGDRILIDANAAGHGWYIDPTPLDDSEFGGDGDQPDGIDLLTVISHEFGHILGLGHQPSEETHDSLMSEELATGIRRTIQPGDLELLFSDFDVIAEALDTE